MKLDTVYSDDGLLQVTSDVKKEIIERDEDIDEELELQDNVDIKANLDYDPEQIRRELEEEGEFDFY
jgi:putative ubiquitin-RnfH superfamily antitoxin RatB of RatAB toxin-antitoxin module